MKIVLPNNVITNYLKCVRVHVRFLRRVAVKSNSQNSRKYLFSRYLYYVMNYIYRIHKLFKRERRLLCTRVCTISCSFCLCILAVRTLQAYHRRVNNNYHDLWRSKYFSLRQRWKTTEKKKRAFIGSVETSGFD